MIFKEAVPKNLEKLRKTLVMEFSFNKVGDCNFTIKEFHQRFFPVKFDINFYDILPVLKAVTVVFLIHFNSCPAEAISI